jgi:2,5-diketo-D-gluconate reductase B
MTAIAMDSLNGIPVLGFGTFPLKGGDAIRAVTTAIELGIRHIDTAQMYGNEQDVGKALKATGIPRTEIYLVTKVDPSNLGAERFAPSVAKSLEDLNGPVDLLLIHWPPAEGDFDAALERLIAARDNGMTRSIGVSNFSTPMMRRAQRIAQGTLICNQVEFHPLLDQRQLLETARSLGMVLAAYSPLARGKAMLPDIIQEIARRLNRPPSEIVLRWIIQQGVAAIPMTTRRENALSNLNALRFSLAREDMEAISSIGSREGRTINPSWMRGRWD